MSQGPSLASRILRNDLRIYWRSNLTKKAAWATSTVGRVALFALTHGVALGILFPYEGRVRPAGGAEMLGLLLLAMTAMAAVHRSLEVLYNRGDMELLLASPVPARTVLLTRLVDVTVTSLLSTATVVVPLLDMSMLLFGGHWGWGLVAWLGATMVLVPAAILVTVAAVERIGARRARVFLQVFGILLGMGGVIAAQLPNLLHRPDGMSRREARGVAADAVYAWFDVPPLRQVVAAATGEWQWLLPLCAVGLLLFLLAHRTLAARFVTGAQGAIGDTGKSTARRGDGADAFRGAFTRSRARALLRTEVLLLRRDPLLLMRCGMQVVSLVPMLFGAMMLGRGVGIGSLALLASAVVPVTLAAMLNANDEGHEFVASSPLSPRDRARARATAAAAPFVALSLALAGVVGALAGPVAAILTALGGSVQAAASAWLGTCTTRAHTAEERARNKPPRLAWQMLACMASAGLGTAGLGVVGSSYVLLGWILFAVSLGGAGLMFLARPQRI